MDLKKKRDKTQLPTICCLKDTHCSSKDKHRLKVKAWIKIILSSGNEKRAAVATNITQNQLYIKNGTEGYIQIKDQFIKRYIKSKICMQPTLDPTLAHLSILTK